MKQEQVQRQPQKREVAEVDEQTPLGVDESELLAAYDDIIDEIDGVLEENAEEFVKNYRQRGGE